MNNKAKISSNAVNPQIWVEEYRDYLFKYAITRLRNADLTEESIQETFLAALQSRKSFRGLASEKNMVNKYSKKNLRSFRKDKPRQTI
jgi:RNA polymerase sigma-70 factor (ECF subfamily)